MFAQEEKKEVYGAETLYREVGYYQKKRKQYVSSLQPFDKAVEITPDDLRTLLGRSWSRAKSAFYKCALQDINKAVDLYPDNLEAKQLKALYMFLITDFENAMVENYRGIPKRKQPDLFILGAMHCAEAIEKCIGKRGGHALRDHYDIIRTIAWKRAWDLRIGYQFKPRFKKRKRKQKKTDNTPALYTKVVKSARKQNLTSTNSELSILESLTDMKSHDFKIVKKEKSPYQPPQRRTTNMEKYMAEKYLEKMCLDKSCLKKLKVDPRMTCPNKEGSEKLIRMAKKEFKALTLRQEILRIRHPFYSIKYSEVVPQGAFLQRQEDELKKVQDIARHDTETLIKNLRAAREAYLTNTCIRLADNAKTYIDKSPTKILPNKETYLKQIYELIGLVHLDVYRLRDMMSEADKIKRINFLFGLPISREPSQDSIVKENRKEFFDIRKAIYITEKRMSKATSPLETVWLFYELARLSVELRRWDLCRFYARRSLNMARILGHHVWATNSSFLITRTHVLQRNRNDAKNELMTTREYALKLKHPDIITYIDKCIEVVESFDYSNISTEKVIKQREKQIIKSLTDLNLQKDIELLFQKMSSIPGNRRMPIMPGIVLDRSKTTLSRKSSGKPSIHPKSKNEVEFQLQFGASKKGLELLED